ncbi:mCG11674, isoform CRA_a [Mus musculus]|nr:mCG11674, isoform CRA_a [Mus musculus]EDL32408.1 mCG11674, isoform CRA_a [Mus musculus]EDL32409.1 mCG11674, isoform CRA_a [Mus musculus]
METMSLQSATKWREKVSYQRLQESCHPLSRSTSTEMPSNFSYWIYTYQPLA